MTEPSTGTAALEGWLDSVATALQDGWAIVETQVGGERNHLRVRLRAGQTLVDWQTDDHVGGCLLHPPLLARLITLHATVLSARPAELKLRAGPAILRGLSPRHARLVEQLGQLPGFELRLNLRRDAQSRYLGGSEALRAAEGPDLLRISVRVQPPPASARTSPGRS